MRVNFTIYKYSTLATIIGIFGTIFEYGGVIMLLVLLFDHSDLNSAEDVIGYILGCVCIFLIGVGLKKAADKRNNKACQKQTFSASPQNQQQPVQSSFQQFPVQNGYQQPPVQDYYNQPNQNK